ncbi:methyltransferase domain-containing protein [Ensifer aridi]|uniref:methyltransferase domain-containing protein n=1 Tax=Ensifer aridi TaxID=1708715 RepID=UPI0009C16B56
MLNPRSFSHLDVDGFAVEPNPAVQAVTHELAPNESRFDWVTAKDPGFADACANGVLLGNAYQFVAPPRMFREAYRILEQDGW